MSGTQPVSNNVYYSVVDGEFKVRANRDTPGAVSRVNKKGVEVWEVPHKAVFGVIEAVAVYDSQIDGKPVKTISISLDPDENGKIPVLNFGVDSKNGGIIMSLLPNIKAGKEVRFMPFANFVPEGKTEPISGLSLHTKDNDGKFTVKIDNYFYKDGKPANGLPVIDYDKASEADRKIHQIKKTEFLLKHFTENVLPKFKSSPVKVDYPEGDNTELRPEDIPF